MGSEYRSGSESESILALEFPLALVSASRLDLALVSGLESEFLTELGLEWV